MMHAFLRGILMVTLSATAAYATDEIQVYNAEIAAPGQWTIQQHLNYVAKGIAQPDYAGGVISDKSLNGTPELAYGLADWWEVGFYAPFAVQKNNQFLSDSIKLRTLFVTPHADQRDLFYGLNFEISNATPKFSQSRFGLEVRPIIGMRKGDYELIVNPIVDFSFGDYGDTTFTPAVRFAKRIAPEFYLGAEYYADFGSIGNFSPIEQQQHTIFAVTDFKAGVFDVNLGVGYGLTSGSDRVVFKTIIGYAFPAPGGNDSPSERATTLVNPTRRLNHQQ